MKKDEHPFIDYENDYELSKEDEAVRDAFYGDYSDFIPCPGMEGIDKDDINRYIWDDFEEAKEFAQNNPEVCIYTVIDGYNDTLCIIPGWHIVNRISYFFTNNLRPIPEDGCYY